jgi:hypothetical protein
LQERKREQEIAGHYDFMRKHKRKSIAKEDLMMGSKKFPTYTKSKYRSSSIAELPAPKSLIEKERSLGKLKKE